MDRTLTGVVQLTTTVDDEARATELADTLLDRRLAACVQVLGPVTSRYRWKGELSSSSEWMVVAKTAASLADDAVAAIAGAHPYDVPEVLVTPVLGGHQPYLDWVIAETAGAGSDTERP